MTTIRAAAGIPPVPMEGINAQVAAACANPRWPKSCTWPGLPNRQ